MVDDDGTSFLSRWSRRKAQAREADVAPEATPAVPVEEAALAPMPVTPADEAPAAEVVAPSEPSLPASGTTPPPPTLDDVERLTPEADFSPFVDRLVQPEVRNAAMKKLFTDPHFNVMDGLDVYIDDYNKTEPMPRQWLRQLVQARVLGLLDDEVEEQPRPDTADEILDAKAVDEADVVDTVQEPTCAAPSPDTPTLHEDTHLPLQQDDAAGHGGARAAADDGPDRSGN
jgi:hypothetical protein